MLEFYGWWDVQELELQFKSTGLAYPMNIMMYGITCTELVYPPEMVPIPAISLQVQFNLHKGCRSLWFFAITTNSHWSENRSAEFLDFFVSKMLRYMLFLFIATSPIVILPRTLTGVQGVSPSFINCKLMGWTNCASSGFWLISFQFAL